MNMDKFFVKPAVAGARVPDPASGDPLPAAGAWKPRVKFWLRRLAQKEIVVATPTSPAPPDTPAVPAAGTVPAAQHSPAAPAHGASAYIHAPSNSKR
jgi:hypothetical protein